MAETDTTNAYAWNLVSCTLINNPLKHANKQNSYNLTNGLISFTYYEDLDRLNPTATASFSDIKNEMPVTTGQGFSIVLGTPNHYGGKNVKSEPVKHAFLINRVKNTQASDGTKIYSVDLVSFANQKMSSYKSNKQYTNVGNDIISKVFKDSKLVKDFGVGYVYATSTASTDKASNPLYVSNTGKSIPDIVKYVRSNSFSSAQKGNDTAGYMIWGSKKLGSKEEGKGHDIWMKSIDGLLDSGGDYGGAKAQYTYYQGVAKTGSIPEQLIAADFKIQNEGNLTEMMNKGVFRANINVINEDTKKCETKEWNIKDCWDKWGHIGQNISEPTFVQQEWVADFMTDETVNKTFTLKINHQAFNTHKVNVKRDAKKKKTPEQIAGLTVQDWDEQTIVQYNARRATMALSVANMVVPGNQFLFAGDKVNVQLRSSTPSAYSSIDKGADKQRSGEWLIFKIAHTFLRQPDNKAYTTMTLCRDTINKNC